MHGELIVKYDVPLLTDAAGASSSFFEFQPIHLSMGVSLASPNSPMPSAPNASFTPSNRPIFNEVCVGVLDGGVTNAFAHDIVVAAVMRIDDFIFSVYMMFNIIAMLMNDCIVWPANTNSFVIICNSNTNSFV